MAALDQILDIAEGSPVASFRWRDRGVAPRGYVKRMSVAYARVYCKLKAGAAGAIEMAKADIGNPEQDALTWYVELFNEVGMDNHTAGVDALRHLFVLLIVDAGTVIPALETGGSAWQSNIASIQPSASQESETAWTTSSSGQKLPASRRR